MFLGIPDTQIEDELDYASAGFAGKRARLVFVRSLGACFIQRRNRVFGRKD